MSSVRLLLAAGADPNSRDVEGNTCLHKAAFVGNYDAILRLVEAKAEIDATDAEGGTALVSCPSSRVDQSHACQIDYFNYLDHSRACVLRVQALRCTTPSTTATTIACASCSSWVPVRRPNPHHGSKG